ncbi:T9SS type A sorting domain-containing protein [Fluviicola taffensis]|uniref:T9SS type A sorting domain-containing protein n=1 Tax=Fluviicola taffensis TaxID=191579 RepID=UPI0031380BC9
MKQQIHQLMHSNRQLICFFILFNSMAAFGQVYTGPIAKPTSGYGSEGTYTLAIESFTNPNFPTENIRIYYPSGITSSVPTLFYSHGYGGSDPLHVIGLLSFFAKKGYAIVFVPYQTNGVSINDRYVNLTAGFRKAARDYPTIIDTTRVGFLGHSFGGGATIGVSHTCFTENNWGQNGRFICPSAQWYSFNITQTELQTFPLDTKMLTFIYTTDSVNDHRMATEIFSNINIPSAEKDFIRVVPSTVSGYDYTTEHDMPTTYAAFDALDYYAYYRLIDALCDYTFNGSLAGKDVALGNGSTNQITMPSGMANLLQTDMPVAVFPESIYGFKCSVLANPRQEYCNSNLTLTEASLNDSQIFIFPNPALSSFSVRYPNQNFSLEILDGSGSKIYEKNKITEQVIVSMETFPKGLYLVKMILENGDLLTEKLIKE